MGDLDLLRVPAHGIAAHGVARTFQNLGLFPSPTFLENTMAGAYPRGRAGFVRSLLRVGVCSEERQIRADSYRLLEYLDLEHLAFTPAADQPFGTLKRLELARALAAKLAAEIAASPQVRAGKRQLRTAWLGTATAAFASVGGPDRENMARLDDALDKFALQRGSEGSQRRPRTTSVEDQE